MANLYIFVRYFMYVIKQRIFEDLNNFLQKTQIKTCIVHCIIKYLYFFVYFYVFDENFTL